MWIEDTEKERILLMEIVSREGFTRHAPFTALYWRIIQTVKDRSYFEYRNRDGSFVRA